MARALEHGRLELVGGMLGLVGRLELVGDSLELVRNVRRNSLGIVGRRVPPAVSGSQEYQA